MTAPVGPYTPVIRVGDWVYVSGQVGLGADGALVEGGVAGQTAQAMANLQTRLSEAGASIEDVVKTTCFLVSMDDYATFNTAYIEPLGAHRPTRSCVAVAALPLGAVVEVEAVAFAPASSPK